jgi:hypothetical protein
MMIVDNPYPALWAGLRDGSPLGLKAQRPGRAIPQPGTAGWVTVAEDPLPSKGA